MKFYFIYISLFLCAVSCKKEKPDTDIELLKKYMILPVKPEMVKYEITEKKLRTGSQDCNKLLGIVGILKFSRNDFNIVAENLKRKKKYDIELSLNDDFYKDWYPSEIKNMFTREKYGLTNHKITSIYSGDFFKDKNKDGNILCFITDNNEVIIKIGYCE